MTPVHRLGEMSDAPPVETRELTVKLPVELVDALEEIRADREMVLPGTAEEQLSGLVALALRDFVNVWPARPEPREEPRRA